MLTKARTSGWSLAALVKALDHRQFVLAATGLLILAQAAVLSVEASQGTLWNFPGAGNYGSTAANLVQHGFYSMDGVRPSAYRPPVYPLYLAGLMLAFGPQYRMAAVLSQAVLGIGVGVLTLLLAWRLFGSRLAALLAAGGYVVHYTLLLENMRQRETVLFSLLMLLFFLGLRRARSAAGYATLAGLAALAYLTRPTGLLLSPLLPAAVLLRRHSRPAQARYLLLMAGVVLVVIAPWHLYVYRTFHTFSFLPTSTAGINLYHGNNPDFDTIYPYVDVDELTPAIQDFKRAHGVAGAGNELVVDQFLKQAALTYMAEHPLRSAQNALIKLAAFYSPVHTPFGTGTLSGTTGQVVLADFRFSAFGLARITHLLVVSSFLLGLALLLARLRRYPREQKLAVVFILGYIVVVTLLQMITVGETRYRLPLDPLFLVLASEGYAGLIRARVGVTQPARVGQWARE
jgi:hypothetical protein